MSTLYEWFYLTLTKGQFKSALDHAVREYCRGRIFRATWISLLSMRSEFNHPWSIGQSRSKWESPVFVLSRSELPVCCKEWPGKRETFIILWTRRLSRALRWVRVGLSQAYNSCQPIPFCWTGRGWSVWLGRIQLNSRLIPYKSRRYVH